MKVIVVIMLVLILGSLGSGLFFLISDRGQNRRTVKALTLRIGLSVALFLLLGRPVSAFDAGLRHRLDQAARPVSADHIQ